MKTNKIQRQSRTLILSGRLSGLAGVRPSICVRGCVSVWVCMFVCVCVHMRACVHMQCWHACVFSFTRAGVTTGWYLGGIADCLCVCACVCVFVCVCVHTHWCVFTRAERLIKFKSKSWCNSRRYANRNKSSFFSINHFIYIFWEVICNCYWLEISKI